MAVAEKVWDSKIWDSREAWENSFKNNKDRGWDKEDDRIWMGYVEGDECPNCGKFFHVIKDRNYDTCGCYDCFKKSPLGIETVFAIAAGGFHKKDFIYTGGTIQLKGGKE